jgi:hypothetical protein
MKRRLRKGAFFFGSTAFKQEPSSNSRRVQDAARRAGPARSIEQTTALALALALALRLSLSANASTTPCRGEHKAATRNMRISARRNACVASGSRALSQNVRVRDGFKNGCVGRHRAQT